MSVAGLAPPDAEAMDRVVRVALAEDLGAGGDLTTRAIVAPDLCGTVLLVSRRPGVLAGLCVFSAVFSALSPEIVVTSLVPDGRPIGPGEVLARVSGPVAPILTGERTALNFAGHLSGIATLTARFLETVAGTGAIIRDTRKTTPGLRVLERYAVRCGGGHNHRDGLWDALLIKDNHIAADGSLTQAVARARRMAPTMGLEVEVESIEGVREALACGVELILLDNFDLPAIGEAVALCRGRARTEASGGITLDNAGAIARLGVDFLAIGALTHSAPALDLGLDVELVDSGGGHAAHN
ncbi:MAG: carboxylating nicotinate-nucleotide diphosphorylase [Actinomycetota bacterium]